MSKVDIEEVKRLAELAKIGLSDEEVAAMAIELGRIVEFVEQLRSVDLGDLPTTDQVTGLEDVFRPDVVTNSDRRDDLLANAPQTQDGYIKVPKVL